MPNFQQLGNNNLREYYPPLRNLIQQKYTFLYYLINKRRSKYLKLFPTELINMIELKVIQLLFRFDLRIGSSALNRDILFGDKESGSDI